VIKAIRTHKISSNHILLLTTKDIKDISSANALSAQGYDHTTIKLNYDGVATGEQARTTGRRARKLRHCFTAGGGRTKELALYRDVVTVKRRAFRKYVSVCLCLMALRVDRLPGSLPPSCTSSERLWKRPSSLAQSLASCGELGVV
jgi:hypothetical protein